MEFVEKCLGCMCLGCMQRTVWCHLIGLREEVCHWSLCINRTQAPGSLQATSGPGAYDPWALRPTGLGDPTVLTSVTGSHPSENSFQGRLECISVLFLSHLNRILLFEGFGEIQSHIKFILISHMVQIKRTFVE